MILLLGLIVFVTLLVLGCALDDTLDDWSGRWEMWRPWVLGIALCGAIVCALMCAIHPIESYRDNVEIIALRNNVQVARAAAEELNNVATVKDVADGKLLGGLENMQQSQQASAAWLTYRDLQMRLNELLAARQVWAASPWTSWITVPLPRE